MTSVIQRFVYHFIFGGLRPANVAHHKFCVFWYETFGRLRGEEMGFSCGFNHMFCCC
jgi:hypothetical protein